VTTRLLPYGPGGWLVELDEHDVIGYAAALRAIAHHGVAEVVPGARTVLVRVTERSVHEDVGTMLTDVVPVPVAATAAQQLVEIPVTYDGEDLDAVAAATGQSPDGVIARHAAPTYTCAFCGFAPGFAYLVGLDPALQLPRRATPRTRVPAGSVAIAAEYSAVYPSSSPGGWHVIGRSSLALWDPLRERAALVEPGTTVRFVPVGR
jgi:5-oxoprolinase (ATP-hydrolysing) subunit B